MAAILKKFFCHFISIMTEYVCAKFHVKSTLLPGDRFLGQNLRRRQQKINYLKNDFKSKKGYLFERFGLKFFHERLEYIKMS